MCPRRRPDFQRWTAFLRSDRIVRRSGGVVGGAVRLALGASLGMACALPAQERASGPDLAAVEAALVRQSQAAIIRERRLADERERGLLAELEGRVLAARRRLDSALKTGSTALAEAAAARAALITERRSWAALVDSIARRTSVLRTELEHYRAELRGLVASASPEKLAALERFGDGDRVGAWPVIRDVTDASIKARAAAANEASAKDLRELAQLREVMRTNGEATIADVLAILNEAVALNPSDPLAQALRTSAALRVGDVPTAETAARAALRFALSPSDSSNALGSLASVYIERGEFDLAEQALRQRSFLLEPMAASAEAADDLLWSLAATLAQIGGLEGQRGQLDSAETSYQRSLQMYQRVTVRRPSDPMLGVEIAEMHAKRAGIAFAKHDDSAAVRYQTMSVSLLRQLRQLHPHHRTVAIGFANGARRSGDLASILGKYDSARVSLHEAHRLFQEIIAADESDVEVLRLFRRTIEHQISLAQRSRAIDAAEKHASELIETSRRIVRLEPGNAQSKYDLAQALFYMGNVRRQLKKVIEAHATIAEGLAISREVYANSLSVPDARRLLRQMLTQMGDADSEIGDSTSSLERYEEALIHAQALVTADSASVRDRRSLAWLLRRLAESLDSPELWQAVVRELEWVLAKGALETGELSELEDARRRAGRASNRDREPMRLETAAEGDRGARRSIGSVLVASTFQRLLLHP